MLGKQNWLARARRGFGSVPERPTPVRFDLVVGGEAIAFDLEDERVAEVAVDLRTGGGDYLHFRMPPGEHLLLRSVTALDAAALTSIQDERGFLIFALAQRFPDFDPASAFVIRTKARSEDFEQSYRIGLVDPRATIVVIPKDLERIHFGIRVAGEGMLPRLRVTMARLLESELHADTATEERDHEAPVAPELDWLARIPAEQRFAIVADALAAQASALASRVRTTTAALPTLRRQSAEFGDAAGEQPVIGRFLRKLEEAEAFANLADAAFHTASRHLRERIVEFAPQTEVDPPPPYARKRSSGDWRGEIVAAALPIAAEHGLFAAFAHLWRQVEPVEYKLILDEFAEALHAGDPDLARRCLLLSLGFDPSQRRLQMVAGKLFKWGQLGHAGALIAGVTEVPDTRFIGELKLALTLKRHARSLVPARGLGQGAGVAGPIAYIAASSQPWSVSGYTSRTQELLAALIAAGEQVICYTRPGFPWDREQVLPDTEVPERVQVGPIAYVHSRVDRVEADPGGYMTHAADALIERFSADPPGIVHAASNYRNALPALIAARALGIPFIYEVRGLWELTTASRLAGWEDTERFAFEREMERFVVSEADLVLTITAAVRDELLPDLDGDARARLLPNAVDPERFRPVPRDEALAAALGIEPGDLVLVYAGSLVAYEGLDDVVTAIGLLRRRGVPARLVIVGDGRARAALMAQVAALGLGAWVRFAGRVAPEAVTGYLALADVVPIARKHERVCELVSPLKPFEAMAMEKAVVVSDLPALTEIVEDGARGRICRAEDPAHLAQVLAELHADPAARAAMGRAAREWVIAERSWTAHARTLAGIYAELCGPRAATGRGAAIR